MTEQPFKPLGGHNSFTYSLFKVQLLHTPWGPNTTFLPSTFQTSVTLHFTYSVCSQQHANPPHWAMRLTQHPEGGLTHIYIYIFLKRANSPHPLHVVFHRIQTGESKRWKHGTEHGPLQCRGKGLSSQPCGDSHVVLRVWRSNGRRHMDSPTWAYSASARKGEVCLELGLAQGFISWACLEENLGKWRLQAGGLPESSSSRGVDQ